MRLGKSVTSVNAETPDGRRFSAISLVSLPIIVVLGITNYLSLYNDTFRLAVRGASSDAKPSVNDGRSAAELAQIGLLLGVTASDAAANIKYLLEKNQKATADHADLQRELGATRKLHQDLSAKHQDLEARHFHLEKAKAELEGRTKAAAKKLSRDVAIRATRGVARHVGGAAGESIPVVGTAVVAAMLALDVKDACDLMKEVNEMNRSVGVDVEDEQQACGVKVPDQKQLAAEVGKNWQAAYQAAA